MQHDDSQVPKNIYINIFKKKYIQLYHGIEWLTQTFYLSQTNWFFLYDRYHEINKTVIK